MAAPYQLNGIRHDALHFRKQADEGYVKKTFSASTLKRKQPAKNGAAKNNVHDLLSELKFCSQRRDLRAGRRVHTAAVETGNDTHIFVATALLNMYSKCGSMIDALGVFQSIKKPDVVSWTALILGYANNGESHTAVEFFCRMKIAACSPNSMTYVAVIKACTSLAENKDPSVKGECLKQGREIHLEIGHHMDNFVQSALINMYAKCGSMTDSRRVFNSIENPDVVCWTAVIMGYAENGEGHAALEMFSRMKLVHGCSPDSMIYVAALKACIALAEYGDEVGRADCLQRGREIHLEIGRHMNHFVQSTLINMYSKCRSMPDAQRMFNGIHDPNLASWNALILGYAENGKGQAALRFFSKMKTACVRENPDSVTYVAAIKACSSLAADMSAGKDLCLKIGREIHSEIGHHMDHFLQSTLIDMYAKSGSMLDAQKVFDTIQKPDVVCWTALILGYAENGKGQTALNIFSRMKTSHGCAPNSKTYVSVIKACTSLAEDGDEEGLKQGKVIHLEIGLHMDQFVQSALVNMYANFGSMVEARRVFENIEDPNVVSWTALIQGYADNGEGQTSLDLFSIMKTTSKCAPNSMTYIAALKACGSIGGLAIGRKLHSEVIDFHVHVVTCLVDFYAKCGSMVEAHEVFDSHPRARDIGTWTALLAGYGRFGDSVSVFNIFDSMQDQGIRPDAVTFVCMLLCCSHAGLVEKARLYLEAMNAQYGVVPSVIHYSCMVDVLGRANKLDEAVALLQKMPCNPNAVTWMALLGACGKWKNVEIGRMAFQSLLHLNEKNSAAYVVMAQIYASRGMWEEQERVLQTRRKSGALVEAFVMDDDGLFNLVVGEEINPLKITNKLV